MASIAVACLAASALVTGGSPDAPAVAPGPASAGTVSSGAATSGSASSVVASTNAAGRGATQASSPAALTPGLTRIDVDGDGKADRTTLTKVRSTRDHHIFALATTTATGRRTSTLVRVSNYLNETSVKDVWWGASGVDGMRGGEVILDIEGGVGDFPYAVVYTMRRGSWVVLRAPGAKSDRTDWSVANHPTYVAGYEFSMSKGVRRVIVTRLRMSGGDMENPIYAGYRTSFRWGRSGWISGATQRLRDVPDAQAQKYNGFVGLNWR